MPQTAKEKYQEFQKAIDSFRHVITLMNDAEERKKLNLSDKEIADAYNLALGELRKMTTEYNNYAKAYNSTYPKEKLELIETKYITYFFDQQKNESYFRDDKYNLQSVAELEAKLKKLEEHKVIETAMKNPSYLAKGAEQNHESTYKELNRRANRLPKFDLLDLKGVIPERRKSQNFDDYNNSVREANQAVASYNEYAKAYNNSNPQRRLPVLKIKFLSVPSYQLNFTYASQTDILDKQRQNKENSAVLSDAVKALWACSGIELATKNTASKDASANQSRASNIVSGHMTDDIQPGAVEQYHEAQARDRAARVNQSPSKNEDETPSSPRPGPGKR